MQNCIGKQKGKIILSPLMKNNNHDLEENSMDAYKKYYYLLNWNQEENIEVNRLACISLIIEVSYLREELGFQVIQ